MRVERDAVATDARARIKRHEAEGFRGGRANHFPRVDAERIAEPRHLVRHADVDGAKSVFQKLGGFGDARWTDSVDLVHDLGIETGGRFGRIVSDSPDDVRD